MFIVLTFPLGINPLDFLPANSGCLIMDKEMNQWKVDWKFYWSLLGKRAFSSLQGFDKEEDWLVKVGDYYVVIDDVITTAKYKSNYKPVYKEGWIEKFSKWFLYQTRLGY
jgi:hypothetical protein